MPTVIASAPRSLIAIVSLLPLVAAGEPKASPTPAEKKEYTIRPTPAGPPEFSISAASASDPRLEPSHYMRHLGEVTVPTYRFHATTKAGWEKWRADFRPALAETIGLPLIENAPLKVTPGPVDRLDGYTRMAFTIETAPELYVPAFLLVPDGAPGPRPAVLVAHGHGYGMNQIVGLKVDGSPRAPGEGNPRSQYQHDMGLQAVRAGFVTLVYDQLGFGRRRDFEFNTFFNRPLACEQPSKLGIHYGQSMTGLRVFDALRMIDFLQQRAEVDPDKIAMVGISGGGLVTQFTAALDDRIKAACVSGHINRFANSILAVYHCIDNYVPDLARVADNADIACLIAPRPLLVEAGTEDRIFPISATYDALATIKTCYTLLGAADNLETDIRNQGHEFSGARTWSFFKQHLGPREP